MTTLIAVITVTSMWAWAVAHQLVIYYFCSVAIDQLPKPSGNNPFYTWFFGMLHLVAANWNRAKMGVMTKPDIIKVDPVPKA